MAETSITVPREKLEEFSRFTVVALALQSSGKMREIRLELSPLEAQALQAFTELSRLGEGFTMTGDNLELVLLCKRAIDYFSKPIQAPLFSEEMYGSIKTAKAFLESIVPPEAHR